MDLDFFVGDLHLIVMSGPRVSSIGSVLEGKRCIASIHVVSDLVLKIVSIVNINLSLETIVDNFEVDPAPINFINEGFVISEISLEVSIFEVEHKCSRR